MGKLILCATCGKEIASTARACPQCGAPRRFGLFTRVVIGVGIVALMMVIVIPEIGGWIMRGGGTSVRRDVVPTCSEPAVLKYVHQTLHEPGTVNRVQKVLYDRYQAAMPMLVWMVTFAQFQEIAKISTIKPLEKVTDQGYWPSLRKRDCTAYTIFEISNEKLTKTMRRDYAPENGDPFGLTVSYTLEGIAGSNRVEIGIERLK